MIDHNIEMHRSRDRFLQMAARASTILLWGGVIIALLVIVWIVYHYQIQDDRQFTSTAGAVLYYSGPACVAIAMIYALRLKDSRRINAAVLCVAFVFSAYLGEIAIRIVRPISPTTVRPRMDNLRQSSDKGSEAVKLSKKYGIKVDMRSGMQVVSELKRNAVKAIPFISPANNLLVRRENGAIQSAIRIDGREVIPLGSISGSETVLCNENGAWITYRSDPYGFNNPREVWSLPAVDVAILGDSFAQGYCVPVDKSIAGIIRKAYPATLNLGMAGNGPLLMLATEREYLSRYKPKIVLWLYCEDNDLLNLETERRSPILWQYLDRQYRQPDLFRQADIDRALINDIPRQQKLEEQKRALRLANQSELIPGIVEIFKLSELRSAMSLVHSEGTKEQDMLDELEGPTMVLFRKVLLESKTDVEKWGGALWFVYLPGWSSYFGRAEAGVVKRPHVLQIARELNCTVIDAHQILQTQCDKRNLFPFGEPGHYTELGHQIVAGQILEQMKIDYAKRVAPSSLP